MLQRIAGDNLLKFFENCFPIILLTESGPRDEPAGYDRGPVARWREYNACGDTSVARACDI